MDPFYWKLHLYRSLSTLQKLNVDLLHNPTVYLGKNPNLEPSSALNPKRRTIVFTDVPAAALCVQKLLRLKHSGA